MTLGERIRLQREQNRMTLEDVAKYISVSRQTVFKYENGIITNIPSDKIELLAKMFNVDPSYLMGWSDNPEAHHEPDTPETTEARILAKGIDKLDPEQRAQALAVVKAMFAQHPEIFED